LHPMDWRRGSINPLHMVTTSRPSNDTSCFWATVGRVSCDPSIDIRPS
jgi:hypothetical protein